MTTANATAPAAEADATLQRETGEVTSGSAQKLKTLMSGAKNATVNLSSIYINKAENVRDIKNYTEQDIEDMATQIEAFGGLMQPLGVAQCKPSPATENKSLILVWGYRRAFALLQLGETDPKWVTNVPVKVVEGSAIGSNGQLKIVQLAENVARKNLNAMEAAVAIEEALSDSECDFNAKDIAIILGLSSPIVSQYRKLLRLPKNVQELISTGKLPFSHAREMISRVGETSWDNVAKKGVGLTYGDFMSYLDQHYPKDRDEGADEGDGSSSEPGSSQKPAKMLRASDISNKYIPALKKIAEGADKTNKVFTAADLANARLDAIQTVMKTADTQLAKDVAPYIQQMEDQEAQAKATEDAKKKEEAFYREKSKRINELYENLAKPDPTKPDAKPPMLTEVYAMVAKEIWALKPEDKTALGFDLPKTPEELVARVASEYTEYTKEQAENKKKRDETKAKKEAEKKAAEAAGTAAPAQAG